MVRIFVALITASLASAAALAQIGSGAYTDSDNHFQIKAAPMWSRDQGSLSSQIDAWGEEANPYRTCHVTAAWARSSSAKAVYPWIYIEVTPVDLSGWSFRDIEKAFDTMPAPEKTAILGKPMLQLAEGLAEGDMILDRDRKRIVEKTTTTDDENIPVTELTIGFLGKQGVVHLGFIGDSRQLDYYLPEFQKFVDNFQWDAGYAWSEPAGGKGTGAGGWTANRSEAQIQAAAEKDAKASRRSSRNSSSGSSSGRIYYRGVGGLVALVLGIIGYWARRQ